MQEACFPCWFRDEDGCAYNKSVIQINKEVENTSDSLKLKQAREKLANLKKIAIKQNCPYVENEDM